MGNIHNLLSLFHSLNFDKEERVALYEILSILSDRQHQLSLFSNIENNVEIENMEYGNLKKIKKILTSVLIKCIRKRCNFNIFDKILYHMKTNEEQHKVILEVKYLENYSNFENTIREIMKEKLDNLIITELKDTSNNGLLARVKIRETLYSCHANILVEKLIKTYYNNNYKISICQDLEI